MQHGNAAVQENIGWWEGMGRVAGRGYTDVVGDRRGWGATFRQLEQQAAVYHFPFTSPVMEFDNLNQAAGPIHSAQLMRVGLLFESISLQVRRVDVWAGESRLFTTGPINLSGNFRTPWRFFDASPFVPNVFDVVPAATFLSPLNISVIVFAPNEGNIRFIQVGALIRYSA